MPRFRVTAEVRTMVVLEVEAADERSACEKVVDMTPEELVAPGSDGLQGAQSMSLGDVKVHRLGHAFDRAKVKNLIGRLSDEDADEIVSIAEQGHKDGLEGLHADAECRNSGIRAVFETAEWAADGVGKRVSDLEDKLGLAMEILSVYAEAHEAGLRDGGHLDPEDCGLS